MQMATFINITILASGVIFDYVINLLQHTSGAT